jgi:hypothetical protein
MLFINARLLHPASRAQLSSLFSERWNQPRNEVYTVCGMCSDDQLLISPRTLQFTHIRDNKRKCEISKRNIITCYEIVCYIQHTYTREVSTNSIMSMWLYLQTPPCPQRNDEIRLNWNECRCKLPRPTSKWKPGICLKRRSIMTMTLKYDRVPSGQTFSTSGPEYETGLGLSVSVYAEADVCDDKD